MTADPAMTATTTANATTAHTAANPVASANVLLNFSLHSVAIMIMFGSHNNGLIMMKRGRTKLTTIVSNLYTSFLIVAEKVLIESIRTKNNSDVSIMLLQLIMGNMSFMESVSKYVSNLI